jgi:membrane protease YdiL (CAAX protease family)
MEPTRTGIRALVSRYPLAFAVLWFAIEIGLLRVTSLLPGSNAALDGVISLAAILVVTLVVLAWMGWLGAAGFTAPARWRDLRVLWPAVLVALLTLSPLAFTFRYITSGTGVAFAVGYAVLTAASEEAIHRGLILQTLRPYGLVAAALLSALFFGLAHLNNLLSTSLSLLVFAQVIYAFLLGIAYAAFRLRTNTIWPLIALHACSDVAIDISFFATAKGASGITSTASGILISSEFALIAVNLALAIYGLLLLRPMTKASGKALISGQVPDSV